MVDARVLQAVRETLGSTVRRVLVTGGTGFVGSRVAWLLAEAGQQVTVAGRNRYRLGRSWHPKASFVGCDIRDARAVTDVCRGQDVVIHSAALSAPWGAAEKFRQMNVQGTRNVIEACRSQPGIRLVHVSSTAIHFDFGDQSDVLEEAAPPRRFACAYAASKAAAETLVAQAAAAGLDAVIVRARAVFGPSDNSLLPRLLEAARQGRLRRIGPGDNRVDLTYVDNLAYALCLAVTRGEPGSVCTITNAEPVLLWPLLEGLLAEVGLPVARRHVPYRMALWLAALAEAWHSIIGRRGEPALTRYTVGLLAKSQTFSPSAARRVLDYRPLVSMREGVRHTVAALAARDVEPATTFARVDLLTTGYTPQPYYLAERGQRRGVQPFHATCALIRHPRHGRFLFDTGYAPRISEATRAFPYRMYRWLVPVVTSDSLAAVSQLAEQGIAADDVRGIIISHFHADHLAGLRDFGGAELIASQQAWDMVAGRTGFSALRRAYLPQLLPDDFAARLRPIEHFHDPGIDPFERSHDLFGDGSVRLVALSGHARGQIGALVQTGPRQRTFLVADATWTLGSLRGCLLPHPLTYAIIDSVAEYRGTLDRLHAFSKRYPEVEIIPTHCPEVARRYGLDAVVESHLRSSRTGRPAITQAGT